MRRAEAIALTLLLTAAGVVRAQQARQPVVGSVEEFRAILAEDPGAARHAFHARLAERSPPASLLRNLARAYADATQDTLLVHDLTFAGSVADGDRSAWLQAISLDEEGALLRAEHLRGEGADGLARSAERFRSAIAIYERVGDLRREAVARGSLGVSLYYAKDWAAAREAYLAALETRRALGDSVLIGNTLNALGSVCNELGELDDALDYYGQAAEVRERIGDAAGLGATLTYIGTIHYKRNDLARAHDYYLRGLRTAPPDSPRRVDAQQNLASVLVDLGDLQGAVDLYEEAKLRYESEENSLQLSTTRTNLGITLVEIGDYSGALGELLPAVAGFESLGDSTGLANSLNALSEAYLKIGDYSRAGETAARARSIAVAIENDRETLFALRNAGDADRLAGDTQGALRNYEDALDWARMHGDSTGVGAALGRMGDVRLDSERKYEEARELYQRAFGLYDRAGLRREAERQRVNVGNALNALGRLREGREQYARAIEWASPAQDPGILWPAYLGVADGYELAGQLDSARVYNDLAIDVIESTWGGQLSGDLKASFTGGKAFVYEAQVHVLAKLHEQSGRDEPAAEAFRVAERARARALRDLLQEAHLDPGAEVAPALAAARDSLDREISSVQYRMRSTAVSGTSGPETERLEVERERLERERRGLDERIRLENPHLAALDAGQAASIEDVRSTLLPGPRTALLEYSLGDSASYLWVVTAGATTVHRLPPRGSIEAAVKSFRTLLVEPSFDDDGRGLRRVRTEAPAPDRLLEEGAALYALLVKPAAADLGEPEVVYIVPDGILHYLPFEALLESVPQRPDSFDDPGVRARYRADLPYAFRETQVHYGPSATTLLALASDRSREAPTSLLAVGDPELNFGLERPQDSEEGLLASTGAAPTRSGLAELPFSREEVLAIGDLFPADRRLILLDRDAQESKLREAPLERYGIIHFATHGVIDEARPSRSHLVLSLPRSPGQDGYLQASEIYDLRIGADLVVLSACETGLGKMVRGEGVLGLPRAFLFAGARSVIVSLWSVSDRSTASLMQRFYRSMVVDGESPASALRDARNSVRREPQYAHPYYWAGFVLMGPAVR